MREAILILLILTGCKRTPDLTINGKQYSINKHCISSHIESQPQYQLVGNSWMMIWYNVSVCDQYKVDTVEFKP